MATLIIEHSDAGRSDRAATSLRDQGHRLRIIRPHAGDPVPADLDDVDAIVSCGGPQDPDANDPWMLEELELLRRAVAADLPVLGLCLGCQLLARALGGEVARLEGGPEFGWHEVSLSPVGREDPLYAGAAWTSMQPHAHAWHVAKLPEDAVVLASSARTPVQAWRQGIRTYGVQYHPEWWAQTMLKVAEEAPGDLQAAGLTMDELRRGTETHGPAAARLADRFFERVALVLMPLDRRFAGIAKDLHH